MDRNQYGAMPDVQAKVPSQSDLMTCYPQFTEGSTHRVEYIGAIPELQDYVDICEVAHQGIEALLMRSTTIRRDLIFEEGSNISKDGNFKLADSPAG